MDTLNDFMVDGKGRCIPSSMVSDIDKLRDRTVRELTASAKKMQDAMREFKAAAMGDLLAFVETSAEEYDVKYGGIKGNISLVSYDGTLKLQLAIQESISFDERLQAAKQLIDECLTEWSAEGRDELKTIIFDAFSVDQEGKINTRRILGLRKYDINDSRWVSAMRMISDSIQIIDSKQYLRFYEREKPAEKFRQIPLDMAAL